MKLDKTDRNLDNPKYKEGKNFKVGGFYTTKKTVKFFNGKKSNGKLIGAYKNKKEVEFFEDD